jgi:hypothetical protein
MKGSKKKKCIKMTIFFVIIFNRMNFIHYWIENKILIYCYDYLAYTSKSDSILKLIKS